MVISTYTLNHFGIVAGTCRELQIAETVDALIPPDPQQKVSVGQALVAMIINGLGFSNRRLYLFPQFFENKPISFLVGKNICSEDLNDDSIGRALDNLFEYGCTELFCHIASEAVNIEQVNRKFGHLDSTTFSVYGEYKSSNCEDAAIHITHGHSKQKRPDLKQIFLNLLVSSDGGIPLFMQVLDGNSSDMTTFRKTVTDFKKELKKHLQEITYWIADSCFYTEETIRKTNGNLLWISRVPDKIKEAKKVISETALSLQSLTPLKKKGYTYRKHYSTYGSVKQRWLIIHSAQAEKRAVNTVEKKVKKEVEKLRKLVKNLNKKKFSCEKDALNLLTGLKEKPKYHAIRLQSVIKSEKYLRRGRPTKSKTEKKKINFLANCIFTENTNAIQLEIKKKAIFIVATNELSEHKITDQEIFDNYKGQQTVERGFRFLKDPLFFASSLFLKKPSRIVALTMTMCLSLLVYSICERKLRKVLKDNRQTIRNQLGKPTPKPTLRWIFQLFEDIHMIKIEENGKSKYEVKNLRPDGINALKILGKNYMEPYLLT